jgi:hypothetical protein
MYFYLSNITDPMYIQMVRVRFCPLTLRLKIKIKTCQFHEKQSPEGENGTNYLNQRWPT